MYSVQELLMAVLIIGACLYVGNFVGKWLFGKNAKLEQYRKAALRLSIAMREFGLTWLPQPFEDFAIGNGDDLIEKMHDMFKLVESGTDAIMQDLEATFERVLDKKLSTPEGLALIKAKIVAVEPKK
jgi:hypothetical protein